MGGVDLIALIGGIVGGFIGVCCVGGMLYVFLKTVRRWYNQRQRHHGNQAPQAPVHDVDSNTSQYIPPSPVNLSINLSTSINVAATQSYNDQLLYPYEIFSLDIEDPAFPEAEEVPADIDTGTMASAPILPRDYHDLPAYSL